MCFVSNIRVNPCDDATQLLSQLLKAILLYGLSLLLLSETGVWAAFAAIALYGTAIFLTFRCLMQDVAKAPVRHKFKVSITANLNREKNCIRVSNVLGNVLRPLACHTRNRARSYRRPSRTSRKAFAHALSEGEPDSGDPPGPPPITIPSSSNRTNNPRRHSFPVSCVMERRWMA